MKSKDRLGFDGMLNALSLFFACYYPLMSPVVRLRSVSKKYRGEGGNVDALKDASLEVEPGAFVAVMGPSGCGKSTLLHIIGAMDRPTHGEVWLKDLPLHTYDEETLTRVRRTQIGFVFQFFYLLPTF